MGEDARNPTEGKPVVEVMDSRIFLAATLLGLLPGSLLAQGNPADGFDDVVTRGANRTAVAAPSGAGYRGTSYSGTHDTPRISSWTSSGGTDVFGQGPGSGVTYVDRSATPRSVMDDPMAGNTWTGNPSGFPDERARLEEEIRAQEASLRDLNRQIAILEEEYRRNPDPALARVLDDFMAARRRTEESLGRLRQRHDQVRSGAGTGTGTGTGSGTGTGAGQGTGNPVAWIHSQQLTGAMVNLGADVENAYRLWPGPNGSGNPDENPTAYEKHRVLGVAIDAIMDIRDPELRARVHEALTIALSVSGTQERFSNLLAVVSQTGYSPSTTSAGSRSTRMAQPLNSIRRSSASPTRCAAPLHTL